MTPDEMERQILILTAEVKSLRERHDQKDANGLRILYFRNLLPKSGAGTNGTANQAARADHTH
jgi:hypothetical protein